MLPRTHCTTSRSTQRKASPCSDLPSLHTDSPTPRLSGDNPGARRKTVNTSGIVGRKFLLVKCINGEKATYNTRVFSSKRERTYQILLEDAGAAYGREQGAKQGAGLVDTIETGGVLGIRSIHATFLPTFTSLC